MTSGPGTGITHCLTSETLDRTLKTVTPREKPIEWRTANGEITNDYWDAVRHWVGPDMWGNGSRMEIGPISLRDPGTPIGEQPWVPGIRGARTDYRKRWSWTMSDPATVDFVAAHAKGAVVDPLAGSGWWAALLASRGIPVTASDLYPPDNTGERAWHQAVEPHHPIAKLDAVEAMRIGTKGGRDPRTLLLAWPPYADPLGADVLTAYRGERVIYMGETHGGCCGDDRLWEIVDERWTVVAAHRPVQWSEIHDRAVVLERK